MASLKSRCSISFKCNICLLSSLILIRSYCKMRLQYTYTSHEVNYRGGVVGSENKQYRPSVQEISVHFVISLRLNCLFQKYKMQWSNKLSTIIIIVVYCIEEPRDDSTRRRILTAFNSRAEPSTKFGRVPSTEYLRPFLSSTEYRYRVPGKMCIFFKCYFLCLITE